MSNLTSSLTVRLIDDVSKPARTVAAALKTAEKNARDVARAMQGSGATDRLVRDLSRLRLSAKDIQAVSAAWKDYARSAGLAASSSSWTKAQQAQVRTWESNTIRALRHVKAEQKAFHRAQAAAMAPAGIAGVGVAGAAAGRGWRRDAVTAAAAYGLPGTAGSLVGAGSAYMVGGAAGLGVASAGAAAAYGIKQAIDFDRAMSDVKKKVNLDEGASWGDVEEMVNKNARTFGIARTSMAELAATAGQAGVSYRDLAGFMQTAAKTSSAWDISAKDAAQTLAEVRAQTQWTNPQLAAFADKVNYLGDISAAAEKDVGSMWQRASAGAKAANVSYDDSLVALTALRSAGMQEEVAARFFGQFTSRLRTATSQGKDAAAAFKLLGTSAKAVEAGMKKDSMATMVDVIERIAKSKDGVKAALGIGGKEWFDEVLRAKEALPELKRIRDALATGAYRGSLDKSLKEDLATTNNHLERTKALTSEIGDKLMRWSLPPINAQLERLLNGYETAQKTGFLPGPDGGPIDRLKEKTPIPFSEANRRLFLRGVPQGESVDAYERRLRVNQSASPMFSQIEGAGPHLSLQQIDGEKANVVAAANQMKDALSFTASPRVDTGSAMAALDALLAKVNALKAALASIGGAAASATGQVNALSAAAGTASAKVGSLRATSNANFGASGQKGE